MDTGNDRPVQENTLRTHSRRGEVMDQTPVHGVPFDDPDFSRAGRDQLTNQPHVSLGMAELKIVKVALFCGQPDGRSRAKIMKLALPNICVRTY